MRFQQSGKRQAVHIYKYQNLKGILEELSKMKTQNYMLLWFLMLLCHRLDHLSQS